LESRLRQVYGLPAAQASCYAQILMPTPYSDPLLRLLKTTTPAGLRGSGRPTRRDHHAG
jgi:hypothetical protein